MPNALLEFDIRRKAYSQQQVVLESHSTRDLAFTVNPGEICCLFGASGCGKSTMLRMIAGIDLDYDGTIFFEGSPVVSATRAIGMVMQGDASFPWLTVAENITFAMRYPQTVRRRWSGIRGRVKPSEVRAKAEEMADLVQLPIEALMRYPNEISGGMKQRMLFARALVPGPRLLLLDEPFSSLDYESRQKLQDVLLNVRDSLGIGYVCVSHDPDETLLIADELLLLGGSPTRIVERWHPGFRGDRSKQFSIQFQQSRRELNEWLSEYNARKQGRI